MDLRAKGGNEVATPQFIHGKLGTVSLNGTLFNALQFSFSESVDLEDITYSTAGGATSQVMLPGYRKASGTISFVYDVANPPTVSPQNMIAGTLLTLVLYPEGTKAYSFQAYSGTFEWSSGPQAGAVKCTTTFQSTGTITEPTS